MAPLESKSLIEGAKAISKTFEFSPEDVQYAVDEYTRLMKIGLENEGEAMTMIPTYVTAVPNGTEKGVYLAVDLGGTNFRVCSVVLTGDSKFTLNQAKAAIPRSMMTSDAHTLFSFLARQVKDFVDTHHSEHFAETPDNYLQLGFTFSFPVDQKAINKGYLLRWTKGFDIQDAIGKDVCELLQNEIDALGVPVKVAALVNDTVGTLMARSYTSPSKTGTLLGGIFGTGTNGAYLEKLENLTKMAKPGADVGEYDKSTGEMVVNTEWGSFDNAMKVLPNTEYDRELDLSSVNPGMQMFEKRVSGMFLGEILRIAMVSLKTEYGLFSASEIESDAPLNTSWSVDTSLLSFIEADESKDLIRTKSVLEEQIGVPASSISTDEARAIKILVHAIGKRSARLAAVPIAAIIVETGKLQSSDSDDLPADNLSLFGQGIQAIMTRFFWRQKVSKELETIDIGVDGSVVEFYPGFENYMREALREVRGIGAKGESRITMGVAKDGSGVGAALIALVATKVTRSNVESSL